MRQLRWVILTFVCFLTAQLWAAGAPTLFVSTGSAGNIYSVNTATANNTLLVSTAGADYEGMVVAPDSAGTTYPFLVYACDTANSKIIRFDPNAAIVETVYAGGAGLQHPHCGRITSTGDLVVSSKDAGSGLWIFTGITGLELGSAGLRTPTQLVATPGSDQGLAQKNIGDLLIVDNSNNQVLRAPAPAFGSTSPFITSGLSQPVGIARRGDGDVFVSNQGGKANVLHFNAQGQSPTTCQTFKSKDVPFFMQMSLDDTLYVAVSSANSGFVRSVNAGTCQLLQTFSLPAPAVGIALSPSTATQNVVASNGSALVNFGFAALELNQISGACSGSVSVSLYSPLAIANLITLSGESADPAVNLGLDGFEAVLNTANLSGCTAKDGVTNNFQISDLVSPGVINPEVVVCDDANTNCLPGTVNLVQIGAWPIKGYLPQDLTSGGNKGLHCNIFLVSARENPNAPGQEPGTFCGFQAPVNNTFNGVIWDPKLASSFSAGKSIPVKFKLSPGTNSTCQSAPYITDAIAQLSVAQIADAKGNSVFVTIGLVSNGSSGLAQPLFKTDNNQQYLFNWDSGSCIMPSGVTQVCPKGTYSVTVGLVTNNTSGSTTVPPQSIYTVQTTLVVLK